MRSGIYQLTFPSGKFYIGKSVDIDTRWKQHTEKLSARQGAKLLQAEWNKYGYCDPKVLHECHVDHLDIVEALFISRNCPPLNTTIPKDPMPHLRSANLGDILAWLNDSTLEHINLINSLSKELRNKQNMIDLQEKMIEGLSKRRDKEELATELGQKLRGITKAYNQEIVQNKQTIEALQSKVADLSTSWWEKLFK